MRHDQQSFYGVYEAEASRFCATDEQVLVTILCLGVRVLGYSESQLRTNSHSSLLKSTILKLYERPAAAKDLLQIKGAKDQWRNRIITEFASFLDSYSMKLQDNPSK